MSRMNILYGFVSLMLEETFLNHGLRKNLAEKLRDIYPTFSRFPSGYIVESFSMETAWYFRNTAGPVLEGPFHWLMWHNRTTGRVSMNNFGCARTWAWCRCMSETAL